MSMITISETQRWIRQHGRVTGARNITEAFLDFDPVLPDAPPANQDRSGPDGPGHSFTVTLPAAASAPPLPPAPR